MLDGNIRLASRVVDQFSDFVESRLLPVDLFSDQSGLEKPEQKSSFGVGQFIVIRKMFLLLQYGQSGLDELQHRVETHRPSVCRFWFALLFVPELLMAHMLA